MRRSCPWRWLVVAALLACLPSFATASEVWVDAINGADGNDGTRLCPLASLQKGVSLADGVDIHTVHVQPGEYREEVRVDKSHVHLVVDEEDRGRAILYASASSRNMTWRKTDLVNLPEAAHGHVWEANVSGWGSADPKLAFLVCDDGSSEGLPLAREPDWEVTTRWKHHEHWWTVDADAEHGMSSTQLAPLADLTGGRVWIKDGHTGHDTYGPTITQHVGANIRLSFVDDKDRVRTKGHTKFYVEGKVQLLDAESEWCFDAAAGKIYMWPPNDTCPEKLHMEFAKRLNAIVVLGSSSGGETNLDDIVVDGLTIRGANHEDDFYTGPSAAIVMIAGPSPKKISNVAIRNCLIEHNSRGIHIWDQGDDATTSIANVTIEDCEIGHSEGNAISSHSQRRETPAVLGMVIQRCHVHHAGFRNYAEERDAPAINVQYTKGFRFLNNEVHHTGHNGIQIDRMYWDCLVMGSYFWDCGLNGSDEGSIKFHAFHSRRWHGPISTVVMKNIIRGNMGWSYGSSQLSSWEQTGLAGSGVYFDISSGGLVYRNLILDTGYAALWSANRGTDYVWMYNNAVISCRQGVQILRENTHSRVVNNLVMNPSYAKLGLEPDHGDGAAFCGQVWENVSPGESHHNAYRMDGSKQRICTIWYWDELNRRKLKLYDVGEIEELGSGLGEASLTLKGDDTNIVRDAKGYNAYPVAGSPIIDAAAPLPEDVGAILERVGMELDAPVGKGYDIGANEYAGERECVRLNAPEAGTAYLLGRSLEVAWEASDFVGLVQIHLSRDGGTTWEVIKDGVPASWGTYCWKVSGATSREALVRLTDYGGHEYDVSEPFLLMAR